MAWLYGYSIRHPRTVIAAALLLVAGVAPGILRLQLRTDGHALVPPGAPEIRLDREIRDRFGSEDPIVVLIRSSDQAGIFNPRTLQLIQDLTHALQAFQGIRPVDLFSLDTEHNHRVKPGTLDQERFLDPVPTTPQRLEQLRDDLDKIGLFTGTLYSADGRAASVLLGVPHGANRTDLYRRVQDLVAAFGDSEDRIEIIGAPVAEALLGTHILEDLGVPTRLLGIRGDSRTDGASASVPRSLHEFRVLIGRHVGLVPIAVGLMAVIFVIAFRSIAAALLPMAEIGAALIFVFGLMGWCGVPVYLTIAVLPIILTVTGVTDEIHLFTHYVHLLNGHPDKPHIEVVRLALDQMWRPVLKASLTTAISFLSFAISDITPVWAFGVFTAAGLVFCMAWSFSVVPALLALIDPRRFTRRPTGSTPSAAGSGAILGRLARAVVRFRYAILAVTAALIVVLSGGIRRVAVQDSWIDGFAEDSDFHRTTQYFNEHFLGTHMLLIGVEAAHHRHTGRIRTENIEFHHAKLPGDITDRPESLVGDRIEFRRPRPASAPAAATIPARMTPLRDSWHSRIESAVRDGPDLKITWERSRGPPRIVMHMEGPEELEYDIYPEPLKSPDMIRHIEGLESFVRGRREDTVGGVLGTATYLKTIHLMSRGLDPEARVIPDKTDRIEWLWGQYKRIRGDDRLSQLVDKDYVRSLVSVFLKNANFVAVGRLMRDIRAYEAEHLTPHRLKLHFGGDVAVSQTLIDAIVRTQVTSLGLSLVGDFAVVALVSRSLMWGLFCVIPCALAVAMNFAIMGWLGIPLGVATSMFSGMTLGVGVDYAIHLMERVRLGHDAGLDLTAAIEAAVIGTGRPLLIDALAVSGGFGIMLLSQVPANARLGGLVVMSIANSLLATLVLLPALLRIVRPRALQRTTNLTNDTGGEGAI